MAHGLFASLSSLRRRIPSGLLIACFGLILTAAAWLDVLHRQSTDREAEIERIHRENGGLTRAFEEHVRRVVQSADNALLFLQHEYESNGRVTLSMRDFVDRAKRDPIIHQINVADDRGNLLLSVLDNPKLANISKREHFRVHATSASAGLYIGKPVITQLSGTWSFFLSRRLNRPDGSFFGIVSVGLDSAYFSGYYDNPEIGPDRGVLLVGRDGIVRARRFQQQSAVGQDLSDSPMFKRIDHAPAGHYEVTGSIDSLRRFVSYRALPEFPLIVAVSDLASTALAPYQRRATEYRLTATIFTLFVAIFCLVLIRAERRTRRDNASLTAELTERRKAEEALNDSQGLFSAFLDHIPAVVFVQDLQGRILYSNQAFKDLPGREAIGNNARDLLAPGQDGPPGNRPALRGRSDRPGRNDCRRRRPRPDLRDPDVRRRPGGQGAPARVHLGRQHRAAPRRGRTSGLRAADAAGTETRKPRRPGRGHRPRLQQPADGDPRQCGPRPGEVLGGVPGARVHQEHRHGGAAGGGPRQPDARLFRQGPLSHRADQPLAPRRGDGTPARERDLQARHRALPARGATCRRCRPTPRSCGRS